MPKMKNGQIVRNAARNNTLARHSARSTDLKAELDNFMRLTAWMRECLEIRMQAGMGHKMEGMTKDDISALRDLSIALERAVASRIKYDKHAKQFADLMTPEEELEALIEYFAGLADRERYQLLKTLLNRHNDLLTGVAGVRLQLPDYPDRPANE